MVGFPQKAEQLEEGFQPALHPLDKSDHRNPTVVLQGQDKALLALSELPSGSECLLYPKFSTGDLLADLVQQSHLIPRENQARLPWDGVSG